MISIGYIAWICYIKIDEILKVTLELKKCFWYISVIWFEISLSEVASWPQNSENIQLSTSDEFWCWAPFVTEWRQLLIKFLFLRLISCDATQCSSNIRSYQQADWERKIWLLKHGNAFHILFLTHFISDALWLRSQPLSVPCFAFFHSIGWIFSFRQWK